MAEILVLAEHRAGELREITFQMLSKAADLCRDGDHETCAVVLGDDVGRLAEQLGERVHRVIVFDDPRLQGFDPDTYQEVLSSLIAERRPLLTLLGHTPWSMDLAAALSVKTGYPLATDCIDISLDDGTPPGTPRAVRQVYAGKMFCRVAFRAADGYLATVRSGVFPVSTPGGAGAEVTRAEIIRAEVIQAPMPPLPTVGRRRSKGYLDTGKGEVDICQADLLVSVGRGIGEEDALAAIQELAESMGGTLSCSRPVVDKNWLPKWRQVGTSGKTVRPKVYLAMGISGAFQHVAGMSASETIIAVNRDKKAPIFRVADYGVAADLHEIIAALRERLRAR